MITSKHVREEIKIAQKIVESDATVADKLKAVYKLVEVGLKIALDTRGNTVRVMEKLKVEKVQPRRPRENAEKSEETTKEVD